MKFSPRDITVALLIIFAVLIGWFVLIAALLKLAFAGFIFYAWLILLVVTFYALKRKRKPTSKDDDKSNS